MKERSPSSPAATPASALAAAEALVVEGAHVFVTGRRLAELDAAVAYIGSNVTAVQGDVSKPEDLDRLYSQVKHEKEKIDVLFANAGIGGRARLGEITDKHVENLEGSVRSRGAGPGARVVSATS